MKKWLKYWRIKRELHGMLSESVGMNWWRKAQNDANRIDKVKKIFFN